MGPWGRKELDTTGILTHKHTHCLETHTHIQKKNKKEKEEDEERKFHRTAEGQCRGRGYNSNKKCDKKFN